MHIAISGANDEMFDLFGKRQYQIGSRKFLLKINGDNYIFTHELVDREPWSKGKDKITLTGSLDKEKTKKEVVQEEINSLKAVIKNLEDSINKLD